jgi:hypothetical protein
MRDLDTSLSEMGDSKLATPFSEKHLVCGRQQLPDGAV